MKNILRIILLLLLWNTVFAQVHTFNIDNRSRQYYLYLPNSLPENAPLVFVLHGYSGSASSMQNWSGMNKIADENGFAVCYPQGTIDQYKNSFWQVGYDFHSNQTVDDVNYICSLAKYLQAEYNLSNTNTFCTGMSNGGDMSYLLACHASDVFKAVAPVAGCMMKWIVDSCNTTHPIPVFEIHGTKDNITYWEGDINNNQGYGSYLGTEAGIDFLVDLNSCSTIITDTLPDLYPQDGSFIVSEKHMNGFNNNEIWLYKIVNGGHDWPGSSGNRDIDASTEIWKFFEQFMDSTATETETTEYKLPGNFALYQNYPNPFNPSTIISWQLAVDNYVDLSVFNLLGQKIATLVSGKQSAGSHSVAFDATDYPSGVYYYKISTSSGFNQTQKMVVLK